MSNVIFNTERRKTNLTTEISTKSSNSVGGDGDPYRDSFIRFFGYSHVIGQTTETLVCRPNFTKLCTGVSILYTICDACDKFSKASDTQQKNNIKGIKPKKICDERNSPIFEEKNSYAPYIAAGNAIIWQSLASYIIPAFAVDRITYISRRLVSKMNNGKLKYYLPSIIGISSIPFIITPIDNGVTKLIEIAQTQKYLENDNYRDTYIRLLGYAYIISKTTYRSLHYSRQLIDLCYGISVLYSFADAIDKCNKAYSRQDNSIIDKKIFKYNKIFESHYKYQTISTAVDVFIWQGLASFIFPGYILSQIRKLTKKTLKQAKIKRNIRRLLPTITALSILPFIIIPIDRVVDSLLEHTYRKLI